MDTKPLYDLNESDDFQFPEYALEDDEQKISPADVASPVREITENRKSPFAALLKVMLGPVEGWKSLKRLNMKPERFAAGCFYPLIAIAAVSESASLFFEANLTMMDIVVRALTTFITYFFGYFVADVLARNVIAKSCRDCMKTNFARVFIMAAVSTLAMFHALMNLLPMFEPIIVFFPIWTIYMIVRGVRILRIPDDKQTSSAGLIALFAIGAPYFCNWAFSELLAGF